MKAAAEVTAAPGFAWPLPLGVYDRSSAVTAKEITTLRALLRQHRCSQYRHPHWFSPLCRILAPLRDAVDAIGADCHCGDAAVHLILRETIKRQRTLWAWSQADWRKILGVRTADFARSTGYHEQVRPTLMAVAYLLKRLGDIREYGQFDRTALAHRVFGNERVTGADRRILGMLEQWGFGTTKQPLVRVSLHEAMLIAGSPRLEDLTLEILDRLYREPGPQSRHYGLYRVSLVLHAIGLIAATLSSSFRGTRNGRAANSRDGVDARWLAFLDRWLATSTLAERTRTEVYYLGLKAGRWVTRTLPDQASPELWTRQTAAQYVAAVCRLGVGDWASEIRHKELLGKPLQAASVAGYLGALRTLFRDATEWEWISRRFDPGICFRPPASIRQKIGPKPRVIADDVWAKLVWAGLNLTEADVCPSGKNHMYPLPLLRATAAIWLFAGLRSDEIFRLRVGAISWEPQKDGTSNTRVCYLDVPISKTNTAFVKPVDSIVGEAIESWEKIRPSQPSQLDAKTSEPVDFLLSTRTRRMSRRYLNRILIPALCRKAGVPRTDARGLITSHRARSTIASQLYNAKEPLSLFELQAWLGHRNPASTQFYANVTPTKLARAFDGAGYFERNLRAIDVLIDQAAVRRGIRETEPWKYYDLGHGFCSYDFFDQCAHRMACAKCSFYVPKESSAAGLLEGKANLIRMRQQIPLLESERAAIDDGIGALDELLKRLADMPTPAGPTPRQLQEKPLVKIGGADNQRKRS